MLRGLLYGIDVLSTSNEKWSLSCGYFLIESELEPAENPYWYSDFKENIRTCKTSDTRLSISLSLSFCAIDADVPVHEITQPLSTS